MNSKLNIEKTELDDVLLITPPTIFEDFRGSYVELFNKKIYKKAGISVEFVQDDISISRRGVLRGIHGDAKTWKLVSCLYGSFYLVVVNNVKKSKQFHKWTAFTLSAINRKQVLIPPGFGNGHLVLSETAIFHYKQTTLYDRKSQFTIKWNDKQIKIWWPQSKNLILSRRDS
jgi:dTDP-4-dehydrorhamnose 3,5-epimerase